MWSGISIDVDTWCGNLTSNVRHDMWSSLHSAATYYRKVVVWIVKSRAAESKSAYSDGNTEFSHRFRQRRPSWRMSIIAIAPYCMSCELLYFHYLNSQSAIPVVIYSTHGRARLGITLRPLAQPSAHAARIVATWISDFCQI